MTIAKPVFSALFLALLCAGCSSDIADRVIVPHANAQRVAMLRGSRKQIAAQWGGQYQEFTYLAPDGARLSACMLIPPAPIIAPPATAPSPSPEPPRAGVRLTAAVAADKLSAHANDVSPPRGIVVLLHGLTDQKEGMLDDAEVFARHGYIAVCVDLRAHGKSGGHYTTFGYHERYDMVALLDDLRHRGYDVRRVGVFGRSLGAATALQWAAIDPRVNAVIAVAPFAELRSEEHYLMSLLDPPLPVWKMQWLEAAIEKEGHFHIDDVSPLRAVRSMRTPVYLVRGGKDDVVPASESDRLFDAARGPVIIERIATAGHHDVLRMAGPGFEERALDWMDTFLSGRPNATPPLWTIGIAHRNLAPVQRASIERATGILN